MTATKDLYAYGKGNPPQKDKATEFHTIIYKGLFACKRARIDNNPTIAALYNCVHNPTTDNWKNMILNGTLMEKLVLLAENIHDINLFVYESFAVNPDFKSHTGGVTNLGGCVIQSISLKKNLNTWSRTEAEIVGNDDASTVILWMILFMGDQGYEIDKKILYQDNNSTLTIVFKGNSGIVVLVEDFLINFIALISHEQYHP